MATQTVLGIETSCDETAASILRGSLHSAKPSFQFLSSVVNSQIDIHRKTGGVVPEVAARAHMQNILPVTQQALHNAKLKLKDIDYLAVTSGPIWIMAGASMIGLGLGLNNNTYMVAIQAESSWSTRGIATGAFIFSRIFGQALGAAAFGGILNAGLSRYLQGEGDLLTRILTPEQRASLAPETLAPLMQEFSHALHIIFAILVALALASLAIGYRLPKGRGIRR